MPVWSFIKRCRAGAILLAASFILLIIAPNQSVMGQSLPASNAVRGVSGDLWADGIIGKVDFGEFMPNTITGNRVFNPGGVLVDRSVRPNRLYVYDANSRVLGFNHLGTVTSGNVADIGKPCTSNSDFPGAICTIEEGRSADLVIGQPSLDRGACNGDGNFQNYPVRAPASASTLCGMPEYQISPTEGGSFANMAVDSAGNLYVPDWDNHRVLRYNSPFTTDTIADAVWGQPDFASNACNRGRGVGSPDAQSFCFRSPFDEGFVGGVAIDAVGNLWVADNTNNRVLRFPFNAALNRPGPVANLVLGQPNFFAAGLGLGMNQMYTPAAVRVADTGRVYIADSQQNNNGNGRVLYFDPPYTNGISASGMLNYDFRVPTGLEFDLSGGLWVSDRENHQLLLFSNPNTITKVLFKDIPDASGSCGGPYQGDLPPVSYEGNPGELYDLSNFCGSGGSIGVDSDGNVFASGGDMFQDVWRFPAPIPTPQPGISHSTDARIFKPYQLGEHNSTTLSSLWAPRGIAATGNQLMIADSSKILFWNDPLSMVNGQAADGYVGTPDPRRFFYNVDFGRIREDESGHLWALRGAEIHMYQLPLIMGASPAVVLPSPMPVLGGGTLSWTNLLLLGGLAPAPDSSWIWVSDPRQNRVFRIRDPLTAPQIDIILGQIDLIGTSCNYGLGQSQPTQTSLCQPSGLALDPAGNLYISDHALEAEGNYRLLEFDAALFPANPASVVFAIPASRVIGTNNSFTGPCQTMCGPFEPAFSQTGVMVVGINSYLGPHFPVVYTNPLVNENRMMLRDYGSIPYATAFDDQDNLYIIDKNRGRALLYLTPFQTSSPTINMANVVPSNNASDVPVNINITIPFSVVITATESAFTITCDTPQAFTLTGSNTTMVTLNPNADLPANTSCTIVGTAAGITDQAGNPLASNFILNFTTNAVADITPPTVDLTSPDVAVLVDSNIVLTFSEAVNLGTAPVLVVCQNSNIYFTTTPAVLPANGVTTLMLDPIINMPFTATCSVTLSVAQVVDAAGNQLSDSGPLIFYTVIDANLLNQVPILNVFATGTPTLSWERLLWAASYEVEIDMDTAFALPRPTGYSTPLTVTTNTLTLPTALPEGTYYFRVRGKSATGVPGPYSAPEPFTIVSN